MVFENLSQKLQNIFKNLKSKGKLSEEDVKAGLKEIKLALLEADVSFKVVKDFIKEIEKRAVGEEILSSLTPGQQVIKVVNEELIKLLGSDTRELKLKSQAETTIIMMCGLQGAGKTTTCAKLAGKLKQKGYKTLLVAADIYRPAAIEQLRINAKKQEVDIFELENKKPLEIVKSAIEYARENQHKLIIIDTAGRLHIDSDMMGELKEIKENVDIDNTLLVVDAMTGQDAVNVASSFNKELEIDGLILTKLDGDTRGGAALSIKAVTQKPILYVGMGEKLSELEQFYPDRMASRILGMGDVLSLIEKVGLEVDEEKSKDMMKKLKKAEFDFSDFLEQLKQLKNMGGISSILSMLPNMNLKGANLDIDEKHISRIEAIVLSMTKEERSNPSILNMSRKTRIAKGAGVNISEVNKIVKQFDQMKKMMKQMGNFTNPKKSGLANLFGSKFKLPF